MTRVVISQPMYFPWVGFLAQMSLADVMIWLDDAQFSKGSFTNRVQVKTGDVTKWMTVPLRDKGNRTQIGALRASDPAIADRHRSLLRNAFADAPHADDAMAVFETAWGASDLAGTLIDSAEGLARAVGLPPRETPRKTLRSAQMQVPGHGSARVLALVQAVGGTRYITGHGARNYLDHAGFEAAGIAVEYMDYAPRPWPQGGSAFTPYVTGLDLVARVAPQARQPHLAPKTENWKDFLTLSDGT